MLADSTPGFRDRYTKLIAAGGKQVLLGLHKGLPAGLVANGMSCGISKVTVIACV
jgi:hypothetical protein